MSDARPEILTVSEMYAADRFAADSGIPSLTLMDYAGRAVADEIFRFQTTPCPVVVLCGPGNNGGDGFVVARLLKARGWPVKLALFGERGALKGDAAHQSVQWADDVLPLTPAVLEGAGLVVDALYGAGLSRPLEGLARQTVEALNASPTRVVAVDVPSGLQGDLGRPYDGLCVEADVTVTFFRMKPAHLLMPGRVFCGRTVLAQIGIPRAAIDAIRPALFINSKSVWGAAYPRPDSQAHKYARGHAVVVSGPAHATGAARLAARGALRIGAGLVSIASPLNAVDVNAKHLTAIMVKPFETADDLAQLLADKRFNAVLLGPGLGIGEHTKSLVDAVVASGTQMVLDADALTSFRDNPDALFSMLPAKAVLTPHDGEFERLFPNLLAKSQNKIEAVRSAARIAGCVVLLKGADTAVASPDGRVTLNANAPPYLATAGAGDVLAGFILGLLAQNMDPFLAASAGVWLHGLCATHFGPGLIAEDLPEQLPALLRRLYEEI
jgi:NAD(P)H-hydrate epimerase